MINFNTWLYLTEAEMEMGGGESGAANQTSTGALSPPQHAIDDGELDLPSLMKKRIQMLLDEIEKKRSIPKQQLIEVLNQVVQSISGDGPPQDQQASPEQAAPAPTPPNAPPAQTPQMQPQVAQ